MKYSDALKKAELLVQKMTVEEKISQLLYNSPAIERLGINEYNWWNEALHGVARAGTATVFPQAIGLAASFDTELLHQVADAISTEARAKYNQSVKYGDRDIYKGLTFWSPNVNIFRDPRWGRGQETFGEDPFLTAEMGCSFIKGLQGEGDFLKSTACAKHFAVHSGPEGIRHGFDAQASEKDIRETYLPAFEFAVKKAGVMGIMGAYNRTNGQPCCAHTHLMQDILFDEWGFKGYYVSDCGAISDIYANHHYTASHTESAAVALKRGCDLNCGEIYRQLIDAYEEDMITEEEIDAAAQRVFAIRFMLGEFENERPYYDIPYSKLDCEEHKALNLQMARESLVLLKNENGFLPLSPEKISSIAAVGPNVLSTTALEGNYHGRASEYITVADGIRRVFGSSQVNVAEGSKLAHEKLNDWDGFGNMRSTGVAAAAASEVTVLCLGLDRTIEGEEGCSLDIADYCEKGDKKTLFLPKTQQRLAEEVCKNCENVIVVVMAGSQIDVGETVRKHAKAIIQAWYPGGVGGLAIAELIAGKYSPSGRLPLTFYYGDAPLPDFTDYSMKGRTYRFIETEPLYPFGYGLSYTSFEYSGARAEAKDGNTVMHVTVKNTGKVPGAETVQVYAKYTDSRCVTPNCQLCGIRKVFLEPGESREVEIETDGYWLKAVNNEGKRIEPDGEIILYVGGHQPDPLSEKLSGSKCISVKLR